jgi:hypothetical protein
LAPEILKKLEDYESSKCAQLEKIEELSQAIDRITAENRSTREWFGTRLRLLWEHNAKRDEKIGVAMHGILQHAKETAQHLGLREAGERVEALLSSPARVWDAEPVPNIVTSTPTPTPTPLPFTTSLPTATSTPPFPPTFTDDTADATGTGDPDFPMFPNADGEGVGTAVAPQPNKRPAPGLVAEGSKRRKVGVP